MTKAEQEAMVRAVMGKLKGDATVFERLGVGNYRVKATVQVDGVIHKGEDYLTKVTASIKWQRLAMLMARKLGLVETKRAIKEYASVAELETLKEKDGDKSLEKAFDYLKSKTERAMPGKISTDLQVTVASCTFSGPSNE